MEGATHRRGEDVGGVESGELGGEGLRLGRSGWGERWVVDGVGRGLVVDAFGVAD